MDTTPLLHAVSSLPGANVMSDHVRDILIQTLTAVTNFCHSLRF